jgi:exonuclease III
MNVHAPTQIKDSFYKELEEVFDQFLRYHMKILTGDFNAKVEREDIFKLVIGNESLPKRKEDRSWRKLHNDELYSLYSSPSIVRVIKSRRMRGGRTCGMHGGGEKCLQGFG